MLSSTFKFKNFDGPIPPLIVSRYNSNGIKQIIGEQPQQKCNLLKKDSRKFRLKWL